jgi:hypothetical protein
MPNPTDRWWSASSSAEAEQAADLIAEALTKFGVPALDAIPNAFALYDLWKSGRSPGLTAVQAAKYLARATGTSS